MKKIAALFLLAGIACNATAQQVARANHVQLVSQPNTQLVIRGGINFTGTTSFIHKGGLTLLSNPVSGNADWLDSTSGVMHTTSAGHVSFKGTAALQQVYGATKFDSLTIQNTGINLQQSHEVRQWLNLADGLVYFTNTSDSIYVSNPALTAVTYNTDSLATSSWVHGKLSRRMNSNSGAYFFPIGKLRSGDSLYAPLKFEKTTTGAATFSAQYVPISPINRNNKNPLIDHISSQEYWEVTSHNFAGAGDDDVVMSMSWRDYSVVSPTAIIRDSLLIAHYYFDGAVTQWQPELNILLPNDVNGTVNFGYIRSNKVIGDFSMPHLLFSIGTRSLQNLLPVHFLQWNVVKQEQTAICTWMITDDREVEEYIIERSADGVFFTAAGRLAARRTPDNTTYRFTDNAPLPGRNFYRIKAQAGAEYKYTDIRSVYFDTKMNWVLFPNPATDRIKVLLPPTDQPGHLRLTDAAGKLIAERRVVSTSVEIGISSMAPGVYYLQYIHGGVASTKSFIKQ